MAFYEHLPAFANSRIGLSTEEVGKVLSLSGLAVIVGNLTLGFAIDRCGAIVVFRAVACVLTVGGVCFCLDVWSYACLCVCLVLYVVVILCIM